MQKNSVQRNFLLAWLSWHLEMEEISKNTKLNGSGLEQKTSMPGLLWMKKCSYLDLLFKILLSVVKLSFHKNVGEIKNDLSKLNLT